MSRAYYPRMSTVALAQDVRHVTGQQVRIIPPIHTAWTNEPTRLWLTDREGKRTILTLAKARVLVDEGRQ